MESDNIKAIIPFLHSDYKLVVGQWLENDVSVELILPQNIADVVFDFLKNYNPKGEIGKGSFKIRILKKKLNCTFIISNLGWSLGFFREDGRFNRMLFWFPINKMQLILL